MIAPLSLIQTNRSFPLRSSAGDALFPLLVACLFPSTSDAQHLSPELVDKVADVMAIVVLIAAPVIAITVFWMVHILPEKIAEKRHHPQKEAITTLCLLSLIFGGLLWPIAWVWAYTKQCCTGSLTARTSTKITPGKQGSRRLKDDCWTTT